MKKKKTLTIPITRFVPDERFNDPNQVLAALKDLSTCIITLRSKHDQLAKSARQVDIDGNVVNTFNAGIDKTFLLLMSLDVDLKAAARFAATLGKELPFCHTLASQLRFDRQGSDFFIASSPEFLNAVVDAHVEIDLLIEHVAKGPDDPWIKVELKDIKVNRSTVGRHVEKCDYIRCDNVEGYYEIRKSKLYLYLTPQMIRLYVG